MNNLVKESYKAAINHIFNNTKIIYPKIDNTLTDRETLWLKIAPALYVIGPRSKSGPFDDQAYQQGFHRVLTRIEPNENKIFSNYLKNTTESKNLYDWIKKLPSASPNVFGCHFSHAIAAKDILKNNYSHAIIFENDCAFDNILTNELLEELEEVYTKNIEKLGYLGLGGLSISTPNENTYYSGNNFKIISGRASLTHFYIMNKNVAKQLVDSTNPDILYHSKFAKFKDVDEEEQFYRGGADDFFTRYVRQFYLIPNLAYQQYIGGNKEIRPDR